MQFVILALSMTPSTDSGMVRPPLFGSGRTTILAAQSLQFIKRHPWSECCDSWSPQETTLCVSVAFTLTVVWSQSCTSHTHERTRTPSVPHPTPKDALASPEAILGQCWPVT